MKINCLCSSASTEGIFPYLFIFIQRGLNNICIHFILIYSLLWLKIGPYIVCLLYKFEAQLVHVVLSCCGSVMLWDEQTGWPFSHSAVESQQSTARVHGKPFVSTLHMNNNAGTTRLSERDWGLNVFIHIKITFNSGRDTLCVFSVSIKEENVHNFSHGENNMCSTA